MSLSVCIISKNEEKNIKRCIKSIYHIADEIIVVDTGSTDNTIKIAKEYGTKVIKYKWNKDFSDARNKSLENATKEWILFIDCDEEMPLEDSLELKSLIENNTQYEGFYVRLINIIDNKEAVDGIVFRVFKNNPKYRFEGKMHEQIINSIEKEKPNSIVATNIKINHYGYDSKLYNQIEKTNRNIEILLSYEDNHKDSYYFYNIGNEYAKINNIDKALQSYKKSLQQIEIQLNNVPLYYPYLISNITRTLYNNKRLDEVLKYIKSFKQTIRDFRDIYFFECLTYIEQGKLSLAKTSLYKFINYTNSNQLYPITNFEKDYDIQHILNQLEGGSVNSNYNKKSLSVVIALNKENISLIETIKSINEVAYEVIVVTSDDVNIDEQSLKNYSAKILKINSTDINEMYCSAFNICICDYILILETNEICPFVIQSKIVDFINDSTKQEKGYFVYLADKNMQIHSKSIRLFENTIELHSMKNIENFVNNNVIKDTDICICEVINDNTNNKVSISKNKMDMNTGKNNTISVCIIAKNEQNNIGRCLESVSHIADEIIVVDTGSNDNTVEIAKSYNAKVIYHKFENNFAKARNISLDNATKNWILQLDCDEELDYADSFRLKNMLKDCKFEGYCLKLTNIIGEEKGVSLAALRLFRNKDEYRFDGRIHEQIQTSIKKYNKTEVVDITDIKFYHYGYDSNTSNIESKIKRNLSILLSVPENEKNGFYYYNLGNEYSRINELEKALDNYLKAISKEDTIGYSYHVVIYIVNALYTLKRYDEGIKYGEIFLKQYPTYKDLYFITSICLYKNSNIQKCREYLNKYIEYSKIDYGYPNFNFAQSNNLEELFSIVQNY